MNVKVGQVVTTNPENHSARVKFYDSDDKVSSELTILAHLEMPKVEDEVLCLMQNKTDGFILGVIPQDSE